MQELPGSVVSWEMPKAVELVGTAVNWGPGFEGACREPPRAVRVDLVLGQSGLGVCGEVGNSLYSPFSMGMHFLSMLGYWFSGER